MASGVNDIKDYFILFFPFLVFFFSALVYLFCPFILLGWRLAPREPHQDAVMKQRQKKNVLKKSQGNLGAGMGRVWLQTWRGRCSAAATRI